VARARDELGVDGCCGEPSHGGAGVSDGVVWDGVEVAVGGGPITSSADTSGGGPFADAPETVPLAGGTVAIGALADALTPGAVAVAFTCGDTAWFVGGGLSGEGADRETVLAVAEALIPHLYCTLGELPG
jgi:hypothetical protein